MNDTLKEWTVADFAVIQNGRCLVWVLLGHWLLVHVIVLSVLSHGVGLVVDLGT